MNCTICEACGDSGDSQRHTFGPCEACHGYGEEKNLHLCSVCGDFAEEVLAIADFRDTHELLIERAHFACLGYGERAAQKSAAPVVGLTR